MSWATCPLARTILVYVSKHRFNSKYSDVLALRSTNIAFGLCIELGPLPLVKKKQRDFQSLQKRWRSCVLTKNIKKYQK